jgi:CubicO group peptidase (beta-lactamase class C family)
MLVLPALPFRLCAQTPANQTAVVGSQDLAPKIDEYMNALVKAGWFNGSILIAREGKVFVNKGYGMANFELEVPNTPQTKFRVGSITKPFTAMAIMLLQERGKLSLQDFVTPRVDWSEGPGFVRGRVTVQHCLKTNLLSSVLAESYSMDEGVPQIRCVPISLQLY